MIRRFQRRRMSTLQELFWICQRHSYSDNANIKMVFCGYRLTSSLREKNRCSFRTWSVIIRKITTSSRNRERKHSIEICSIKIKKKTRPISAEYPSGRMRFCSLLSKSHDWFVHDEIHGNIGKKLSTIPFEFLAFEDVFFLSHKEKENWSK